MAVDTTPPALAKQLLKILAEDLPRLWKCDDYLHGKQEKPYMPDTADAEYRELAERCITNVMRLASRTPSQAMYVDAFRRGAGQAADPAATPEGKTPEMVHWQRSRMDARQIAVHNGAFDYGHSFVVTTLGKRGKDRGKPISRGLSALRTSALFEDPANDIDPYAVLTVTTWPKGEARGEALLWDRKNEYVVTFKDFGSDVKVAVQNGKRHGSKECPVTRFAPLVDLEGRTVGVIEPLIELQDRINQSVFDLLIAQTGGSFKVRTVSGMAPPVKRDPETGEVEIDPNTGQPIPLPVNLNAKKFMFAEDPEVKFGSLDETPLSGYIESIEMSFRHFSAIAQVPPHHLLGQIANLSADALMAAETSLLRLVEQFKTAMGESWERVFRLAAELAGDDTSADDYQGEVIWRDMEQKSLAQAADAYGKLADQLGIPKRGLWPRVPGVTQNELSTWEDLAKEDDVQAQLADAVGRAIPASSSSTPKPTIASDLPVGA